nr:hypothetical protein [uncultured Blautia sp.]
MFACATGYYAGRKASAYAKTVELADLTEQMLRRSVCMRRFMQTERRAWDGKN